VSLQEYSVNQHPIQSAPFWVNDRETAIPEIHQPFVWSAAKVRDLIAFTSDEEASGVVG